MSHLGSETSSAEAIGRSARRPLSELTPMERLAYRTADFFARRLRGLVYLWNITFVATVARLAVGRRLRVVGLEKLKAFDRKSRIVVVANHRSFFDFFTIAYVIATRAKLPRRFFFPVRSTFFYENPIGMLINLLMSGMSMFPPILRDPKRARFNRFSIERTLELLEVPGTMVGIHPEGTRNKGDDPYRFLKAKPGVGKVVLEAEGAAVLPVFIHGLTNSLAQEFRRNWLQPAAHPIYVIFGEALDFEDLRREGSGPGPRRRAAERCLEAIAELARIERSLRAGGKADEKAPPLDTP
ncbi:MAG: 1-acyl-sn-glycerol-3-phosphate acyltransferase [Deltaproteobacteria bacterium]|nr:MAG: 1-acyl-sn-glycerol-3-phosphate acyltransferase [Deltaproteobacteria bacterium]